MAIAPGKSFRKGLTIVELMEMFPNDDAAREWFEGLVWANGRHCPSCGSLETTEARHGNMPYWCGKCRAYFSVKKGTVMQGSPLPFRKWALAIYLHMTSLKGVSSMKLHRDIGVTQKTAWFMLQRIREAFKRDDDEPPMGGPVEVDETYVGGKRKNMSNAKRKTQSGRGATGKAAVVGAKDRETNRVSAEVVQSTDKTTLQDFVEANTDADTEVFTDDAAAYKGVDRPHKAVNHSVGEYVRGKVHTNGVESFWAMFKRAHKGTYHKMSPKHLQRYVNEFVGRHNARGTDTLDQMGGLVRGMVGRRLTYKALKADNGLASGARAAA